MPLFKVGNFSQIGVSFEKVDVPVMTTRMEFAVSGGVKLDLEKKVELTRTISIEALPELSFRIEHPALDLVKSPRRWGLYLKSLSLYKSFEGFIVNVFRPTNSIYFTSIAWDYSGAPPFVYPPKKTKASDLLIPLKSESTRRFVGNGINIWPSKTVVGALNVIILVFECDKKSAEYGETLANIHDTVDGSGFARLVSSVSTSPALAAGTAIGTAVLDLVGMIGGIMKRNHSDFVDLFEGSYGTEKPQTPKTEKFDQESAGIELDLTVS